MTVAEAITELQKQPPSALARIWFETRDLGGARNIDRIVSLVHSDGGLVVYLCGPAEMVDPWAKK